MHIKFLGTRGEVDSSAPMHKKHSGILIDGILFDVGEKEFLDLKPKEIFCTHLHPDHAFWIGTKEEPPPHFFYPENIKLLEPIKVGDIKVTPIPTIHSKKVRSVAYLIEKDHLRALYTGDLIWIKKKYQDLLKDLDLVITDGSFNRKGGMVRRDKKTGEVYGHGGLPNLVDLFKKLNAKRIIVTHFGEWFLKDVEKGKEQIRGYSDSIKVEPAFDGKEITLEEKSELGKTTTEEVEPVSPKTIAKIQPKVGLYLVAPHAEMIMTGQKTLIVKSKKFTSHINEPLYLLQDKLCFGIITLKEPYEISPEEFKKLRDKHQITDEEAFKHWGWKEDAPLYAYEFRIDEQFEPPIPVKLPKGIQVFVDAKNIKFQDLKSLTILDLFDFADLEISDELFAKVSEEMFNRGLLQTELIKEATKDWVNQYIKNLKKYTRAQIGDDWRICITPDTPVIANPGIEYISEVKPSTEVKEVLNREINEEIVVIKPRYLLPVKFTKEHPIFTLSLTHSKSNGKVVPKYSTQKLRDKNGRFIWLSEHESPCWKSAAEIEYFDGVQIPKLGEKSTPYPEELFALAGWYLAEGFVSKEPNRAIRFSLHRDEVSYAYEILTLCRKLTRKWNAGSIHVDNGQGIRVDFYDKELTTFLATQFGKGARNKTVPKWVLEAEKDKVWHLLDAYFKGDGWLVKRYLKARTVSKKLAVSLWLLWTKFDRVASLQQIESQTSFGKCISYEISLSFKKKDMYYEDANSFWLPIMKVWKEHYSGKVWNLETSSNTYQVPFTVHNCLGWYSSIKRGKKITKHTDVGDLPITEEDCKKLAVAIVKELIDRGATFNKPETYKKHARELFETVIKEIGVDKIPWKETEEKAKTVPEPTQVGIPNLEDIDDVYVSKLTDDQLMTLHKKLHEIFKKLGKVTEPLENAHIFVWKEIQKRKLPHQIEDGLDRATSLEVIEYPEPEEGVPQQISSEEEITLERVLKAFPEKVFVEDPIHVYLCGRVVNEGKIPASHDIDLLFKQGWYHVPTIRAFLNEISERDPEVAKRLHFVWDSKGPHIGMTVPIYRLSFERVSDDEMRRTSPFEFLAGAKAEIFKPYIGLKPKSGFQKNEFWDIKEMWDKWAKKYIDKGIIVQKKFDGMRFQVHCKGNQCKFITEDRERDRASVFKKSLAELLKNKKADSFIIDAEMVEYACGDKKVSHPDMCEQVPREEMIKWIGAEKKELDDENVVFHVHDCTYLNGEPLNDKPYVERWEAIKKIFPDNLRHWKRIDGEEATDMKTFFRLAKKYRSLMNSEGIVAKASDSIYPIKYSGENRAADWAKLKNLKEIDVMVWKVIQKKTKEGKPLNQYLYECIFAVPCKDLDKYRERDIVKRDGKCYLWIGRTYATGEKVSPGTIVTVRPIRIAEFKDPKGKIYYTWMFPYYEGKHPAKTEPDSLDVVKKLVAIGTGPPPEQLGAWVFDLPICPFWNDERICPLKERFRMPRDNLSSILVEYLKYPIVCPFANHYKCRYVKSYYYGYKEWKVQSEVDEDTGEEIDENQE